MTQTQAAVTPHDFMLTGKRAVVTGASRGLGYDIAIALADYGADVVGFARTASELAALEKEIKRRGRQFLAVTGSVDDRAAVADLAKRADAAFGGIDILVNNAGTSVIEPAVDVSRESWDLQMAVNLTGPFVCAQTFARGMIERGWGRIINISSISGIVGMLDHAPYVGDQRRAQRTHARTRNGVGAARHHRQRDRADRRADRDGRTRLGAAQKGDPMKAKIPIGRFGKPREIAAACVYLASEAAGLCNGHVLVLDGGYTAA